MPAMENNILRKSGSYYYIKELRKRNLILWLAFICVISLLFLGLTLGAKRLGLEDLLFTILSLDKSDMQYHIIMDLRLPRLLAAVLSGSALGLAGAVMQVILRNPLGSPFTLGISNASAFGAALAYIILGNSVFSRNVLPFVDTHYVFITLSAFFWAAFGAFFILYISRIKGATPENMILAGIIINTFFMAMTSILQFMADDVQLGSIVIWTFGDLSKTNWSIILIQLMLLSPSCLILLKDGIKFNALDAGDQVAASLGVDVKKFRMQSMLLASFITATVVAFYGIIAFVGLVIPHIVRLLAGNESRYLFTASMVSGAVFLLLSDLLSRNLYHPLVIPVGIITSIVGAPLFVLLLIRGKKRW